MVVILLSTSGFGKNKKYTYTDTTFHQIEFSEVTFNLDKKTNDTLEIEGLLNQMTIINGIPCYGNISFSKDWEPKKITLADAHTFAGYTFPKDTYIQNKVYIGDLKRYFAIRNSRIYKVNTCKFTSNQKINGLTCESSEEVIFTTDWNLLACILSDDDTVAGNIIQKGTFVRFDDAGICLYCLYDPIIQTYQCKGDNYNAALWMGSSGIKLYPNGQLKYFQPVDDIEVQGVFCKPSSTRGGIWFYESGKLKRCTSAKDQTIDGVMHGKKFRLEFDENGNVTYSEKDKIFD